MFGLLNRASACLFGTDGVVTQTATVHAAAWKEMFDEFLRGYAQRTGTEFVPFDPHHEYDAYVDGKPRLDGTRSFLESRGIDLPEGTPDDPPGTPTLYGLSNRKNNLVLAKIDSLCASRSRFSSFSTSRQGSVPYTACLIIGSPRCGREALTGP